MRKPVVIGVIVLALILLWQNLSFAAPKIRSTVAVNPIKQNGADALEFKAVPNDGHKTNTADTTYWRLEITDPKNIEFKRSNFGMDALNADLGGFVVPVTYGKNKDKASFNYKMVVFICTADRKICYPPETHKGSYPAK